MKKITGAALLIVLLIGATSVGLFLNNRSSVRALSTDEIIADVDKKESIKSLHKLAIEGVPLAAGKLSREFYDGINLRQNDKKAFFWATTGYARKDVLATFILARMYYYGEATNADPQKAISLLNEIKSKSLVAKYILGKIYLDEAKINKTYYYKGISEIQDAANSGLSEAQFDLATSLRSGAFEDHTEKLKEPALKQSAEYLAMAAAQNYIPAVRELGLYFINGIGVKKDVEQGNLLLNEAAGNGDSEAKARIRNGNFDIDSTN